MFGELELKLPAFIALILYGDIIYFIIRPLYPLYPLHRRLDVPYSGIRLMTRKQSCKRFTNCVRQTKPMTHFINYMSISFYIKSHLHGIL
jgi:hypothetical protein